MPLHQVIIGLPSGVNNIRFFPYHILGLYAVNSAEKTVGKGYFPFGISDHDGGPNSAEGTVEYFMLLSKTLEFGHIRSCYHATAAVRQGCQLDIKNL
jgi:hypothetical protein